LRCRDAPRAGDAPPQPAARPPAAKAPRGIEPRSFRLDGGAGTERLLASGGVDSYRLDLQAGQFLHLIVDQRGVDVTVAVHSPGPGYLFRVDSPNSDQGPEDVYVVAEGSGEYRFDVAGLGSAAPGRYLAHIDTLRPAQASDRLRADAERVFARGQELATAGPSWQAVAELEQALRLFTRLRAVPRQAYASYRLGQLYMDLSRPEDGLVLFEAALAAYRALPPSRANSIAIGGSYNELGRAYRRTTAIGSYERAEAAFLAALDVWSEAGFLEGKARALNNLGVLYSYHGEPWKALQHLGRARELWKALKVPEEEARTLQNLGTVYHSVRNYTQAARMHLLELDLLEGSRDKALRATALTQLANNLLEAGHPRVALGYYMQALELEPNGPPAAAALSGVGLCYRRLEDYGRAPHFYRKALTLLAESGDERALGTVWFNLGATYGRMEQPERANDCYRHALALAHKTRYRSLEAMTRFGVAVEARDRGNIILARQNCEQALAIVESVRAEAARPDLQSSYLAFNETYYGLLIELLMQQHREFREPGLDVNAFEWSERARARSLLDSLVTSRGPLRGGSSGTGSKRLAEYQSVSQAISAKDQERRDLTLSSQQREAVQEELDELLERSRELEQRIQASDSPTAQPKTRPPTLDLAQAQRQLLDNDTVLLEYYLGERASFLWALTASGPMRSIVLPPRKRIEPLIRRTYSLLTVAHPEDGGREVRRACRELSRLLLGEVASQLGHKRLVIVANGALQYIPFAVLPDPAAQGELMGSRHEIVYIPSVSVLAELRRQRRAGQADGSIAVLADPVVSPDDPRLGTTPAGGAPDDQDDGLKRLEHSAEEATAIASLPGSHRVLQALSFDANRELVMSGKLKGYSILHIAAHGILRTDYPELSALVLSRYNRRGQPRDGYLRARDLEQLDLPADLVVLSACKTALGREVAGEGLVGLGQGFMAAGARRVLVSLWNVDDPATAVLMKRFYQLLREDRLPPGKALQEAQRTVRGYGNWQSPYFWAGFVLQGDWQ